MVKRC